MAWDKRLNVSGIHTFKQACTGGLCGAARQLRVVDRRRALRRHRNVLLLGVQRQRLHHRLRPDLCK